MTGETRCAIVVFPVKYRTTSVVRYKVYNLAVNQMSLRQGEFDSLTAHQMKRDTKLQITFAILVLMELVALVTFFVWPGPVTLYYVMAAAVLIVVAVKMTTQSKDSTEKDTP